MAAAQELAGDRHADLLPLALSRPNEALKRAQAVLAGDPPPLDASVARQAIGIVLREFGDIDAAIQELRIARQLARRAGSAEREADVLATLGVALVFAGRTASGRSALDAAVRQSTGHLRGRTLLRRGGSLLSLGHHDEALEDLNSAVIAMRAANDQIWEARALTERAVSYLSLGSVRRAVDDLRRAERLFTANGQELESADATTHLGLLALRTGDLPEALTCFDEAAERYQHLGTPDPNLSMYRCAALTAAGLARDAMEEADAAISQLDRIHGRPTKRAELLLTAATCALAAGEPATTMARATEARRLFARQGRRWWRAHAQLAQVSAGIDVGPATAALLRDAQRCVQELADLSSPDQPLARLATGRVALALGRTAVADEHLAAAAAGRRRGPALSRAVAWLAEALRAEAVGDPRRLMYACRHGLDVIDDYRSMLGSSELRAQTTAHGAELASLGLRHALRLGRPGLLLAWSERWRAIALAVPPVRPTGDETLQADLAALRSVSSRISRAQSRGLPSAPLQHEQQRLERAVRARALRTLGTGQGGAWRSGTRGLDRPGLLDELSGDRLLELVDIEGELHVLVCGDGRVRRFAAGTSEEAARVVRSARFALSRAALGPSASYPAAARDRLARLGEMLEQVLLGEAGDYLGDGDVIVVPPGRLHAVPWGLMPRLRTRAVSVAPSAASWLRARRAVAGQARDDAAGPVVLVRGPGLASRGAEVPQLAADYAAGGAGPVVLGDGSATVARVMSAMDGARLVHIAAHGTFRADSPLFSALQLDDGPLTVYDLERLRRGPRLLVLSSCDSAVAAPAGADEVLGLASSLIPLGTAGIVASVVRVNDPAVVPLMIELHRHLRGGASLAGALRDARRASGSDLVPAATGWSFIALGTG
ncbi:MAG TPA: CHAT domain-containing protein [Streptosporangiaceae bacterium]